MLPQVVCVCSDCKHILRRRIWFWYVAAKHNQVQWCIQTAQLVTEFDESWCLHIANHSGDVLITKSVHFGKRDEEKLVHPFESRNRFTTGKFSHVSQQVVVLLLLFLPVADYCTDLVEFVVAVQVWSGWVE